MRYQRLTPQDRYKIEALKDLGSSIRAIARQINRAPSTILRELQRNSFNQYKAEKAIRRAQRAAARRRQGQYKIRGQIEAEVTEKLKLDWSPEQVSGRRRLEKKNTISPQSIYRYLRRDKQAGGKLYLHLRLLRKQRQDRSSINWRPAKERLSERTWISARPEIVEERKRLGDYERDTVFGKANGALLLTLVDRSSRLLKLMRVERKSSNLIHEATVEALQSEPLHTITNDNGSEFAKHEMTERELGAKVYFSHSYRSWERGTNENTNGLLRQYFPRQRDLGIYSLEDIKRVEHQLNSRPRKCLGFKTPLEVHEQLRSVLQ